MNSLSFFDHPYQIKYQSILTAMVTMNIEKLAALKFYDPALVEHFEALEFIGLDTIIY